MKTIGLIGGMSWESTVTYYQLINETIKKELGGLHSAKILLYSVDFAEIEEYQAKGQWDKSAEVLSQAAVNLEQAGADFIVIFLRNGLVQRLHGGKAYAGLQQHHIGKNLLDGGQDAVDLRAEIFQVKPGQQETQRDQNDLVYYTG